MAKGGHSQANFIHGVRRIGPNQENHFTSALILDNYDVQSSGHLKRRKGLEEVYTLPPSLRGKRFKTIIPFGRGKQDYVLLTTSGKIYSTDSGAEIKFERLTVVHSDISRYPIGSTSDLKDKIRTVDNEQLEFSNIEKLNDRFIWAYPSNYFAPFLIELEDDNTITTYPIYLASKNSKDIYPFLRSIPIKIEEPVFPSIALGDFDDSGRVRLYIDKDTDLNSHKECKAWLGFDLKSNEDGTRIGLNKGLVSLGPYLNKPLFFNVLPTQEVSVDSTKDYDDDADFTGSGVSATLSRLNTKVNKLSDVEMSGDLKRTLIRESLFGRKYCIIPHTAVDESRPNDFTYNNFIRSVGSEVDAVTTGKFNMEALSDNIAVESAIPNDAKIKLSPVDISGDDYEPAVLGSTDDIIIKPDFENVRFTFAYRPESWIVGGRARGRANFWIRIPTKFFVGDNERNDLFTSGEITIEITHGNIGADQSSSSGASLRRFPVVSKTASVPSKVYTEDSLQTALQQISGNTISGLVNAINGIQIGYFRPQTIQYDQTLRVNWTGNGPFSQRPNSMRVNGSQFQRISSQSTYLEGKTFNTSSLTLLNSSRLVMTFYTGSTRLKPTFDTPATGIQVLGHEPPKDQLTVEFMDALNNPRDFLPSEAFADNSFYRKITRLGFTRDHGASSNDQYGMVIESQSNLINNLKGIINKVNFGNKVGSLGVWVHSFENDKHIHKAPMTGSDRNELFDLAVTGNKNDFNLSRDSAPQFRMFKNVSVSFIPIYGWSRGPYRYDSGFPNRVTQMRDGGDTGDQTFTDNQGLLAIGYRVHSSIAKITPFVMVNKNSTIASKGFCDFTIGSSTKVLKGFDVSSSTEVQEFREESPSLTVFPSFSNTITISLKFYDTGDAQKITYNFNLAISAGSVAKVYANCFIFEIGAPALDLSTSGKRLIGGNDYDGKHAQVSRFLEGDLRGIEHAAAVGPEDVWVTKGNELYRMSKNNDLYSNNFIERLSRKNSKDYIDTLAISGVSIYDLANQPDSVDKALNALDKFIAVKDLKIKDHIDYSAIEAYLTAAHIDAQQLVGGRTLSRNYNVSLVDPSGGALRVKTIQSNYSSLGIFIGTETGVFIIDSTAFTPSLLSRQVIKTGSNFIPLNNKLIFLNADNILVDLKFSDERKGYVEDLVGRYQQHLYKDVDRLLYNNNTIYGLSRDMERDRDEDSQGMNVFVQHSRIIRAIIELKTIVGYSTYGFKKLKKNDYLNAQLIFNDHDNVLSMLYTKTSGDTKQKIAQFNLDTGNDFENNDMYGWSSMMVSNPLIFNSIVGFIGSISLISPIKGLAIFNDTQLKNLRVSYGNEGYIGQAILYEPNRVGYDPLENLEHPVGFRQSVIFIHDNVQISSAPQPEDTGPNLGEIYGFQALSDVSFIEVQR